MKFWGDDEFPMDELDQSTQNLVQNSIADGDYYLCVSGQNKMKKQFGYAFYSKYHKYLYKPGGKFFIFVAL